MADDRETMADLDELPMPLDGVLTLIDQAIYTTQWRPDLQDDQIYLLEIDVAGVQDKRAFFRQVAKALGTERASGVADKWSAMDDDLSSTVAAADVRFAVIVLLDAGDLLDGALSELIEFSDVVRTLARSAGSAAGGFPRITEVSLILAGTGPNFRSAQ